MTSILQFIGLCLFFNASTYGWTFDISNCYMRSWRSDWGQSGSYDTSVYDCTATARPSGNLTSVVEIVGQHLSGKTNADIEFIEIRLSSFDNIRSIPSNLGDLLPKLTAIAISSNQTNSFESIVAEDLKQFPNLNYLSVSDTQLVSLDGDLLRYTPHIQTLGFARNKVVNVGENFLENLENLQLVNFDLPCLRYYADTPTEVEWLKGNLASFCPPIATTTTTKPPTPLRVAKSVAH